jgi:hypothetical protein
VLGGITAVSGALIGGLVLAGIPVLADQVSWLESLAILGPGLIGLTLARNPDGLALAGSDLWTGRRPRATDAAADLPERLEELGLTVPIEACHRDAVDRQLAIDV